MNYLLFANPYTGSKVLKKLKQFQKPEAVITSCKNKDNWKTLLLRYITNKLTVEDRCRFIYKIPFYDYKTLNQNRLKKIIDRYNIEIGFITTFSKIIPREFAELFPKGLYNIHPSLLPAHAGANPFFWIIYNNEQFSGSTCHLASENLDSGNIVFQTKYNIKGLNSKDLYKKYCRDCREIIQKVLSEYNNLVSIKQNPNDIAFDPNKIPPQEHLKKIAKTKYLRKQINKALKFYNRQI